MARKSLFRIGFSIFCFLCLPTLAFGQGFQGISDLKHALRLEGARWEAGETSMTRLSPEERQSRLGLVPPVHTGKEPLLSLEAAPLFTLPASLDWRNNGGNYVTPVRNQGGCGSCWAFASTGALESATLISNLAPGIDLDLSEQVLVSCGGVGSCGGGSIDSVANFFKNTGLPVESCYPYTGTDAACSNACADWQSSTYGISNWHYVATTSPTVDALTTALNTHGPLVTTMSVYQDFFSYQSGVYHYTSGTFAGFHAVLLVGYDDIEQYFIVKNSWGTDWGESGYFRIAYSELHSPAGFGEWTIAYQGIAPECIYNVSQPVPASFPASGGDGSVSVNTPSDCPWTATSNDPWMVITSGASGIGNGTVSFSVSTNTGSSRTGTLRVAGQTLSVTQDAVPCPCSINPTQQSFDSAGETGSIGVTAGSGCAWTTQSNASWLTITAGAIGSGSGTTVYSVAANSSTLARTGTITVAGQIFTVTQSAAVQPVLGINAGGVDYTSGKGIHYLGDQYFSGGVTVTTGSAIQGTADGPLYQVGRSGNFSYAIPLPDGNYDLTLKFADFTYSLPGQRVFDVLIGGTKVLKDFDIYALSGKNTALDITFSVSVTHGTLNIQFVPIIADAQINALLISGASSPPKNPPIKIKRYYTTEPKKIGPG